MIVHDHIRLPIEGKGTYENFLDDDGHEHESLRGVALTDGCYCKHYREARDWSDKKNRGTDGLPYLQHYCAESKTFMGWACCCWTNGECFEKGKSAGVQRIRKQIQKQRVQKGLIATE